MLWGARKLIELKESAKGCGIQSFNNTADWLMGKKKQKTVEPGFVLDCKDIGYRPSKFSQRA